MRNSFLAILLLFSMAVFGFAQSPAERPSALEVAIPLLNAKAVQTELKLTPAQVKKIDSLRQSIQDLIMSMNKRSSPPSQSEVQAADKKMGGLMGQVLAVLSKTQQTRLRQIFIQQYGIFAIVAKDVKGLVGISAAQESKIRKIQEDADKKSKDLFEQRQVQIRAIPQPKNPDSIKEREAYHKKIEEMARKFEAEDSKTRLAWKKAAEAAALAVLTADQKKKWQAAQGPKFDFSKMG
ncbi:MAG: hypothetical protein KF784_11480 [Fimbriimonadaceae bacterium]|nr:hypothetical protein [Fimbriimonadaceae bacterium]